MSAITPRKIGPVLATFVVANNMIGSGFFLLPATLAKSGGVTALAWLVCTVLAMMLGGAFARLAKHHPELQSPDDYVRPSLGRDVSFLATTMYWVSSWIGNNAIAVAAFGYLVILLPIDDSPGVRLGGQIALIWLMFALNLLGPRPIARFQSMCVVLGLLPVAVILTAGWAYFDPALYRATLGGIAIAGVVYLVSSVLMMGIVPVAELAESGAPFALVAGKMFGAWAIPLIAAAAALKATGTLGGWMLVTGESGARAAQRGFLPAVFGRLRANGSAAPGLFIIATLMTLLAVVTMSPTVSGQFETLIEMVVILVVMAYAAAGLSLLLGTPERPATRRERVLGMGALVACGLLVYSTPGKTLVGGLVIALLAWAAYRGFARRPPPPAR